MIKLYVDMDGVLANFEKSYREMWHEYEYDRKRFKAAVLEKQIFLDLELMPGAESLLAHIDNAINEHGVHVEILTSTGSSDVTMQEAARSQKMHWLKEHGISFKPNFSNNKKEKANWATANSILIDDSIGCIEPFNLAGGHGIHHHHETVYKTAESLYNIINEISNSQKAV